MKLLSFILIGFAMLSAMDAASTEPVKEMCLPVCHRTEHPCPIAFFSKKQSICWTCCTASRRLFV
ncbi:hypothetical protein AB4K20DRAFT_1897540 [Rhizopus microsporus]